jgi:proteasome lid subunit RPN8/RPN11
MPVQYILPHREWRRLSRRAYAAQQRHHAEVCGLFASDKDRRIALFFVRNESSRGGHCEFGWDQFHHSRKRIRVEGYRYLGIFHSHPIAEAIPGEGDLRHARVNEMMLIQDVCGIRARLWRITRRGARKRVTEIPLVIERSGARRASVSHSNPRVPRFGKKRDPVHSTTGKTRDSAAGHKMRTSIGSKSGGR